jgi:hypothetical protein
MLICYLLGDMNYRLTNNPAVPKSTKKNAKDYNLPTVEFKRSQSASGIGDKASTEIAAVELNEVNLNEVSQLAN